MNQFSILLFFIFCSFGLCAQDKIQADRPSENLDPQTVPRKKIQAEIGFERTQQNSQDHSWRHPDALLRYGLFKGLELRMELIGESDKSFSENEFRYGLQPAQLGLKAAIFHTAGNKFSGSFFGQAGIPGLSSPDPDPHKVFYRTRLLFENDFTDQLHLGYNFGRDWDSEEEKQNWVYTLTPQWEISDHWDVFLEAYGHFRHDHPDHNLNGGFAYLVNKNVQLDMSGSVGLTPHSPHSVINAGISVLFK